MFRGIALGAASYDAEGRPGAYATVLSVADIPPRPPETALLLANASGLNDVMSARGCDFREMARCPDLVEIEWLPSPSFLVALGSGAIPLLEDAGPGSMMLHLGNEVLTFSASHRTNDDWLLEPTKPPPIHRHASMCNLMDDVTVVDFALKIVVECKLTRGSGAIFRLVSARIPLRDLLTAVDAAQKAVPPYPAAVDPEGPLPGGADLEVRPGALNLEEAHQAALGLSAGFSTFLREHPESNLATFRQASGSSSSGARGTLEQRTEVVDLTYTASNSSGYQIKLQRSVAMQNGVRTSAIYTLLTDKSAALRPVQGASTVLPPKPMVSPTGLLRWLVELYPGLLPDGFSILDTGETTEPRCSYDYFFTFPSGECPEGRCNSSRYIQFSASQSRLVSAMLDPATAAGILHLRAPGH